MKYIEIPLIHFILFLSIHIFNFNCVSLQKLFLFVCSRFLSHFFFLFF